MNSREELGTNGKYFIWIDRARNMRIEQQCCVLLPSPLAKAMHLAGLSSIEWNERFGYGHHSALQTL